jgi:hypothetical protein
MGRPARGRLTPERFLLAWLPFLACGLAAGGALDSARVAFANLLAGIAVAAVLARSPRSTGRLIGLLPLVGALVLGANVVLGALLYVLDRV